MKYIIDNKLKDKSLEQIENLILSDYDFESNLIKKCHELRKVKIKKLSIENIRMLLGQNIGINILIPISIDILSDNILSEGDLFEGDLLINVLTTDKNYWLKNPEKKTKLLRILFNYRDVIENIDFTDEIKDSINDAINEFRNI